MSLLLRNSGCQGELITHDSESVAANCPNLTTRTWHCQVPESFQPSGDRAYCAGDGTSSDDLLILQKLRLTPNWSCRFGSAEVKPIGSLGDRVLSPCKG